jgi:hypothetical protein
VRRWVHGSPCRAPHKNTTHTTPSSATLDRENAQLWARSEDVERCGYFVSHAWDDEDAERHPGKKVQLMRAFLCLQRLCAQLTVSFGLVAVFLVPLGFALASITASMREDFGTSFVFPWWAPLLIALSTLGVLLGWAALSAQGHVPARLAPWRYSGTTLFLDKCCVLQDTAETRAAGVAGFARFLAHCDGMIVFTSPKYFERLWCVYELATFCKFNDRASLLLFNLEWPTSIFSCMDARLSERELEWLTSFSCLDNRCAKPKDRAFVLGEIREVWKSPTSSGEVEFDRFVNEELPKVLAESKRRYTRTFRERFRHAFDLTFGG